VTLGRRGVSLCLVQEFTHRADPGSHRRFDSPCSADCGIFGRGFAQVDRPCGAVAVIQRANSDLRLSPHFHVLQLDGLYAPGPNGEPIFHPAPSPTQQEVEALVERASKRILRFRQQRGVITLVTAPGDGEITVVCGETIGDKDPLLARLLAAATAGESPAGEDGDWLNGQAADQGGMEQTVPRAQDGGIRNIKRSKTSGSRPE
jgi:hypothetical protein